MLLRVKKRTRTEGVEEGGHDWRKRGVLVHNYSRDLWPEKQFINHSAWANVLQIVLHAAAILVCVKRHNKPGWRTCLGGGGGARRKSWDFGWEGVRGGWKFWGLLAWRRQCERFCLGVFFFIWSINARRAVTVTWARRGVKLRKKIYKWKAVFS